MGERAVDRNCTRHGDRGKRDDHLESHRLKQEGNLVESGCLYVRDHGRM